MSSKLASAVVLALSLGALASAADAGAPRRPGSVAHAPVSHRTAFMDYLRDGRVVTVYTDGRVAIAPPKRASSTAPADRRAALVASLHRRSEPPMQLRLPLSRYGPLTPDLPASTRRRIRFDLEHPPQRFASDRVVVVFKPGVTTTQDHAALTPAAAASLRTALAKKRTDVAAHPFTSDARTNQTLMRLGVDRVDRLFANVDRGTLAALRGRAESRLHRSLLAFDNAFLIHPGASSMQAALRALRATPSVAYAEPDFAVSPMALDARPVPDAAGREIAGYRRSPQVFGRSTRSTARSFVPANAAVSFNVQAFLDAPGVDAIAAFDEIGRQFGQLPGTGEIITNVGLGDVDDASNARDPNDPCSSYAAAGPTTHRIGGQRYLDLPSMPLIPVWVADASGNLSTTNSVCGYDPFLGEVAMDFAVMAPLPHEAQRAGKAGFAGTDLLGIAPGAAYRWIAPQDASFTSILGAFIGAARQQPAPSVITASLGFGADGIGFPGRYAEDDALTQSVIAGIVSANIVVCIAGNDGTRTFTAAAVGPTGGSAATNVGPDATDINDVYYSTAPSVVRDSGAIDAGATTLNDIFSANPADRASGPLANTLAFSETRFNGMLAFSSGFGSRVNVSAPGDNIESFLVVGPSYDDVITVLNGGTSASAPEAAAAAAVALQVGRLTGHPFTNPVQVRDALAASGTAVATPPQADVALPVGPQISVRRLVERLLADAGKPVAPAIARVAVYGRRSGSFIAQGGTHYTFDGAFITALDPSYIKLDGPFTTLLAPFPGSDTAADLNSYITIAPDWEGMPSSASYRLAVAGQPARVLGTTAWTRMLPAQLFAAAGVPMTPGVSRTISLTYSASVGLHVVAESTFQLTFSPPATSSRLVLAPIAPPVAGGATIPVTYDFSKYPAALLNHPTLNVSMPGMGTVITGDQQYPYYSVPLSATSGTVQVPVSALAGGGVYGIWVQMQPSGSVSSPDVSDYAFTRVDTGTTRPPAPLIALGNAPGVHSTDVPYRGSFTVSYDVSSIPGATGAIVEVAAPRPGPNFYNSVPNGGWNTFRNPNGSGLDDNGVVTGSVYHVAGSGTRGTVTIDPAVAKIPMTTTANVRVIATSGANPVGEASDADTVQILGIEPTIGLPLVNVWTNPRGTDGYLVEAASLGTPQSNLAVINAEPFDLGSATTSAIPFTSTTSEVTFSPLVQNDASVIWESPDFFTTMEYFRASPPGAGYAGFSFPSGTLPPTTLLFQVAKESSPTRSAFLGIDMATFAFLATRGDVTSGTDFAPAVDLTAQTGLSSDFGALTTFSYDPDADRAYLLMQDPAIDCSAQSPRLITIDFATRSASSRVLPIGGGDMASDWYRLAVDPTTHTAAIGTSCQSGDAFRSELTLLELTSGTTKRVFQHVLGLENQYHGFPYALGGASPVTGIDPVNHLVLQRSMFCPSVTSIFDINARPCLNEYDESGTLVKSVPGLFADGFSDGYPMFNGVNGTTRSGFAMGMQETFYGSFFYYSFNVQPYRY
ncbi:MAG TPA: S8 family serine peptidase [Candidatus Elarobacter sp.]|jgi:hypothetical protein